MLQVHPLRKAAQSLTHNQVLLLSADPHCIDGVHGGLLREFPVFLCGQQERSLDLLAPEWYPWYLSRPLSSQVEAGTAAGLTLRLWPRKACKKADLPTPRAPNTLHIRTLRCVCPFSWSSLFSRVTVKSSREGVGY